MNNKRFHIVFTDGTSLIVNKDALVTYQPSEKTILFYVEETINTTWKYGNLSTYVVIDKNSNPSTYVVDKNKQLKGFTTTGTAKELVLTLELYTVKGDIRKVKLMADVRFNLPCNIYEYSEWDNQNVFLSIISYFQEIKLYGEDGYNLITSLRRECWNKDREITSLKQKYEELDKKVNDTKKIKDEIITLLSGIE
jgi:hypothetical protein